MNPSTRAISAVLHRSRPAWSTEQICSSVGDAMKLFRLCLIAAAATIGLMRAPVQAAVVAPPQIWIDDANGNLGKVNVATGAVTFIGPTGYSLTDIAFDPSGQLWG